MAFRRSNTVTNDDLVMTGLKIDPKGNWMLAIGWSYKKGDWWYSKDPANAKFFDIGKYSQKDLDQYGIYIGRLALVLLHKI